MTTVILSYFFLVLLVTSSLSCAHDKEINEDKFVDLYVNLAIMWESCRAHPERWPEERERILDQANSTLEDLQAFVQRRQNNPERWARTWEKIVQKLEAMNQTDST